MSYDRTNKQTEMKDVPETTLLEPRPRHTLGLYKVGIRQVLAPENIILHLPGGHLGHSQQIESSILDKNMKKVD